MTRQLARAMPRAEMCFLLIDNKYLNIRAGRWQMRWQLHTLPIGDDGSGWQSGVGLSIQSNRSLSVLRGLIEL
ncbi:hypothetical protein J2Y83_005334 [Pseudomonas marginalis]|uniref:hypothetical protein n=1 Tax=Pseudomonas TaxID=286 RepID=UPI0020A14151|nr:MULTISPECIES: hypothetical protein [Pseudomonas]MCP1509360.1 hypothetical protein [Pseudomonas marginalis]MCP1526865.1 hypothetical protein [Pseudomonas marginalis]MDQ0501874.1 hypothetical protein [Pseudomonas marginalis]